MNKNENKTSPQDIVMDDSAGCFGLSGSVSDGMERNNGRFEDLT